MNIGILAPGKVAEKMMKTLEAMDTIHCVAVGSRSLEKATTFCEKYNIKKAYGSYEELVKDPNVEVIYIASPPSHHYEHMLLALENNKNILCEKSFTVNQKQGKEVLELAKKKNLLVVEGLWTRFLPMVKKIKEIVDSERLGKATSLTVSMCHPNIHNPRVSSLELAGGTLLNLTVYMVHFATLFFGNDVKSINSSAVFNETGVDSHNAVTMTYEDGRVATLHGSSTSTCSREGMICCENGYIRIPNGEKFFEVLLYNQKHELMETLTAEPFVTGFEYQLLAMAQALKDGKKECEEVPHETTLLVMGWMDEMRAQWDYTFPCE